jgi:multiple antibiotic resistance protein
LKKNRFELARLNGTKLLSVESFIRMIMNDLLAFGLLGFTSFFTLINPLGAMPIFMTMATELNPAERVKPPEKLQL